jgi:hypothetical protein
VVQHSSQIGGDKRKKLPQAGFRNQRVADFDQSLHSLFLFFQGPAGGDVFHAQSHQFGHLLQKAQLFVAVLANVKKTQAHRPHPPLGRSKGRGIAGTHSRRPQTLQ